MSDSLKSVIVGTAGHIDHGKSSLVEALTGTHPDRLEEEKRRGITIDLGFAFLEEGGVRFGFIDVPGHERFISNMLAGAAGVDLVLLVIAADESIKPQTREHFEICRLLGVQRGVVALTKSDLLDRDSLELVHLEVQEYLRGSFLESAAIMPVSSKTRAGLAELKQALLAASAQVQGKNSEHYFRLPIDRAFAVKGFGAVVTGTLISGSIAPGDDVELFPGGERLRVRGVQSGGKSVARALAGQRTAVNLAGIEHTALRRGMVLATPGKFRATRRLDARLELISTAPEVKHRSHVHFHLGTSATVAEVLLHGTRELQPGQQAFAQFRLQDEMLALPNDRYIIRQFSPVTTIGGGMVLDPLARRLQLKDVTRPAFLETIARGERPQILAAMVERAPLGIVHQEILARTGWLQTEIHAAASKLGESRQVRTVSNEPLTLVSAALFENVRQKIVARVERFHKENPLLPGISREDLRAAIGRRVRPETFKAALEELIQQRVLEAQGELVKRAGASITLAPEEAHAKKQIEAAFASAGLAVPAVKDVLLKLPVEARRAEKILQMLLRDKNLVRITPELIFHKDALAQLKVRLSVFKKTKGERISVPVFKELTGVTRKYAIPLLEYLDRERVTRRAGDERVIL
jgi:selenocysteine-specific elongation factor